MAKLLFFITLFLNSAFALNNDIVNIYRTQGINAVTKILEAQLLKKEYWDQFLLNQDVSNGYYETIKYLIKCQKGVKNITLYNTQTNKELFSSSVFTGKLSGDKQKEGDLKTPIGAYQLINKLTNLDPFYGPLALATNYPNLFDKAHGKTGHGIWIHGLPTNQTRDEFTQGCIALDNTKLQHLSDSIELKNSILVISETDFQPTKKSDIATILANIFQWRQAWKESNLEQYLSFYDTDFKKSNGQNLQQFTAHKKRIFARKQKKLIQLKNINIIPYPNVVGKNLYKIIMDENYKTNTYRFHGKKELYIELKQDKFHILTES